ncbi:MAG: cysteine desulfurase family protein [Candidatus Latescibacterota bacterium]|nr:cysteine desulfurase family protein [Candidatus Latescibacterota bacterium]
MVTQHLVYADYLATTPVDKRVLAEMLPYFSEKFGNPSSSTHGYGNEALSAVENARGQVAGLVGASAREILFTSGATESIDIALSGVAEHAESGHIVTCKTEHEAVLQTCEVLQREGFLVTFLPVDSHGCIRLSELDEVINSQTIMVSLMAANNEVGTIHPISEIGEICGKHGVLFHCDATQAIGKIGLDVRECNIDLLSFSGHKIYAPKGVGALFVRSGKPRVRLKPQTHGGGQERGLRAGTLNVPGIVGFGAACNLADELWENESLRLNELRMSLWNRIKSALPQVQLNGSEVDRLPGHLSFSIPGLDAARALTELPEIALSLGAACSSNSDIPSHVLAAMGRTIDEISSTLRIGLGRFSTEDEVDYIAERICNLVINFGMGETNN